LFGKQGPISTSTSDNVSFPGISKATETADSLKAFGQPSIPITFAKKDSPVSFGAPKATDSSKTEGEAVVNSETKEETPKSSDPFGKPSFTSALNKADGPFSFGARKPTESLKSSGDPLVSADKKEEPASPFTAFGKPSSASTLNKTDTPFSFGALKPSESANAGSDKTGDSANTEEQSKIANPFGSFGKPSSTSTLHKTDGPFSFGAPKASETVKASGDTPSDSVNKEETSKPANPFGSFGKPPATGTLDKKDTPFPFGAPKATEFAKNSGESFGIFGKKEEPSKSADAKEPLFKNPGPFGQTSSTQELTSTTSQGLFSLSKPPTFGGSTGGLPTAASSSGFSNTFTASTENKGSPLNAAPAFGSTPFGQPVHTPLTPADASTAFSQAFQTGTPTLGGTAPPTSPQNGFGAAISSTFTLSQNPGESLFQLAPQGFDSTQGTATGSLKPTRRFGEQGKRKRR